MIWPIPDNRAMFPDMAANIGGRLSEDPDRRPSDGDHFGNKHDAGSAFKHIKIPRAMLSVTML